VHKIFFQYYRVTTVCQKKQMLNRKSYNYKRDKFIEDAQRKVLSDMSYAELQAYHYKLWLKLAKAYGSEKKLIEAYKKKGIVLKKPPPPVQIAGLGPSRLPGFPEVPTIVPTGRANMYPSRLERDEEELEIANIMGDARLGADFTFDDLEDDEDDEPRGRGEEKEEKEEKEDEGMGLGFDDIGISEPDTKPPPNKQPVDTRSIPIEFSKPRLGAKSNPKSVMRIIEKMVTKRRNLVTRSKNDDLTTKLSKAWAGDRKPNRELQDAVFKIFERNGIYIRSLPIGDTPAVNRAVTALFNLPSSGIRILMNDILDEFNKTSTFSDNPISMTPVDIAVEEVQEPTRAQSQSVREATVDALRQAGVDRGDANRIFEKLKKKLQKERTRIFGESGNYGESTDEANRQLVEWVEDTIRYEIGERGLQINIPNVFRILRESFPILEAIPDQVIRRMPTVRVPTIRDATRNLPEEEKKEVFDTLREAGLVSPNGEIFSYGNIIVRASQSVRTGIDNIIRGVGRRPTQEWDYFDDPENDDVDDPRRGRGPGGGGGPPGGDPGPGGNQIEIWNRGDPNAPMLVYSGSLKQILAMISLFGGSLKKVESFKTDVPPETGDVEQVADDEAPGFDDIRDASVRQLGPGNLGPSKPGVYTPDIDDKIRVAEDDLDNFVFRLNQARMFGATPQQIANLEDQVDKQRQIVIIAKSAKYGQPTEIYPTDSPTPGDPGYTPIRPVEPVTPVEPVPPGDEDETKDDADDEGVVVPDLDKLEPTDTSEGTRIAEYVNPAEVKLFLSTDKEARDEQKRWEEFSRVQPGNSLGNRRTNPLIAVNNEYYRKRFQNCDKTREKATPYIVPTVAGIRRRPWSDPQFVNIYDGYEHGNVRFEADDYHTNPFMSNTLYNPMHVTDQWREFERPSTFHPELKLAGYRFKPTTIPEIRTQPGFKGVDSRPSINNNMNIAPQQTGYTFSPMRRDDDFEPNTKNGRPEKVRTQLTGFNQPVRIKSTRGGR
jgi:hypothetical protein